MIVTYYIASLYLILNVFSNTLASQLVFHTSETVIHPILTKILRLRCSVFNDANSLGVIKSPPAKPTEETKLRLEARQLYWEYQEVGNSSLFATNYTESENLTTPQTSTASHVTPQPYDISPQADITHVMSIIVRKQINGKPVTIAKVTPYDPASATVWVDSDVQVNGNCESSPLSGEQAYIELTWVLPKEEQAGSYTCESYALNSDSLPVSLSTSLEVASSEPSFDDLISYVVDHDKILAEKEKEIELLNNVSSTLQDELQELKVNLTSEISDLRSKFEIMVKPNTESGFITCPFNGFIHFKQEYMVEPLVFTSFVNMTATYNNNYNVGSFNLNIHVSDVNTTGFNLNCNSSSCVPSFEWTSFGYRNL